ncbi:DUF4352 domain-containing protein [Pseudoclavibacter sp. CFCC 14310]|uniref:DUF4352 domain-containing protein n=1 Tax=Pseudoclavibacter sp. CFCC 14310 TaxID=2615180 RepID=UPI001CE4B339|nr:DUF4352 domain-containing protein [Pseudoclavibacter sp. CFCC 14310]
MGEWRKAGAIAAGGAVLATLLLAGCSTETESQDSTPASTDQTLKVGETAHTDGGDVTVHSVKRYAVPENTPDGEPRLSADVELCNTSDASYEYSSSPWELALDGGYRMHTASTLYDPEQPYYGLPSGTLQAGKCARGNIPFSLGSVTDPKPVEITYSPQRIKTVITWTIS